MLGVLVAVTLLSMGRGGVGKSTHAASSSLSCERMGFTDGLVCGSCEELHEFVKDNTLKSECLKCCQDDALSAVAMAKFPKAILSVCG
eukprot:m.96984 g.96984  ORF g.96984 m.96984 type:complete len:88 (-) comp8978_c1_seq1:742-1005(-)